nr:uncharacterized protein LOC111421743 [Onthophagus taurus]
MFMCQYFMTLGSACSQLYLLKISTNGVDSMKAILTLAVIFAQFAIYALPAEQIVTEIYNLAFALYSSSWQEIPLNYQKDVIIMIMKSQNQGYISIGGLFDMNIKTFVSVFRKGFSFYCLLDNLINK